MTKIFCDIAELKTIRKFSKKKIVRGFTTNPSLIRNAGAKDYSSYSKKILKISKNKPVSLEVFADDIKNMKKLLLEYGVNIIEKKEHTIFNSKKLLNKECLLNSFP